MLHKLSDLPPFILICVAKARYNSNRERVYTGSLMLGVDESDLFCPGEKKRSGEAPELSQNDRVPSVKHYGQKGEQTSAVLCNGYF